MEMILDFFINNYMWFLIISLILVFALIGYFVDAKEKKAPKIHFAENENAFIEDLEKEDNKSLKEMIEENEMAEEAADNDITENAELETEKASSNTTEKNEELQ